jgi:DNA-binding transcriptional regulator YiaG
VSNYEQLAYAPEIEIKKAHAYAAQIAGNDKIESIVPIRFTDGAQGFEISILEPTGMLNVTAVTVEQINERLVMTLAEVAELYGIPYSTLAEWARDGRFSTRLSGKRPLTTPKAIEAIDED